MYIKPFQLCIMCSTGENVKYEQGRSSVKVRMCSTNEADFE